MTPTLRIAATAAVLVLGVAGTPPGAARAGTVKKFCYFAVNDTDGDGFAAGGLGEEVDVDEHKKLYCPEGEYVSEGYDCDDSRSTTHDYAPEIPFNGANENCEDGADEPELVYFPNGNQNAKTSFAIRVRLRDTYLVGFGASLAYEVEFYDLAATSSEFKRKTPKRTVGALPSDYAFDAVVTGLEPARVYKAKLRFYRAVTSSVIERGVRTRRTTYEDLSRSSPEYYTTTAGSGILEEARTDLLLQGFYQLSESDRGRIGYLNHATVKRDGTRFGAAAKERWCSEFYTWLTGPHFYQIGMYTNTGGIMWWFISNVSYYPGESAIPEHAERGDYIPHDKVDDGDREADHSTMFLAYDPVRNWVWTLEGNAGNHVEVRYETLGPAHLGVGHLTVGGLTLMNLF